MITKYIKVKTKGNSDVIDITPELKTILVDEVIKDGILFLSIIGSTAGLTTMEYESGLEKDLKNSFEEFFPHKKKYFHNSTWSDDNGHSHLRSTFIKTNMFVSITDSKLDLGTWQQVVLIDFDTRPRERTIVVKYVQS